MYTLQRAFIKVTSHKQQLEQSCGRYCENNNIIVIMQTSPLHYCCEPNTEVCLDDDKGNENHLLLDS